MRVRVAAIVLVAVGILVAVGHARVGPGSRDGTPGKSARAPAPGRAPALRAIEWHRSRAVGKWFDGRLVRGVQLPAEGRDFFTWDSILRRKPDRGWRRWGHDRTIRTLLSVLTEYRALHPSAPRVGVEDLSRRRGGPFGKRYGGLGHASHQNGLDVDILYPRLDRTERSARRPRQVNRALAQSLLDILVAHRATFVFVGGRSGLRGPGRTVQTLVHHDDHMHVRLPARRHGR